VGGDPGIGKSTLILQVLDRLCQGKLRGLYISGEESEVQLKLRADRLGLQSPDLLVATETCLENILKMVEEVQPAFLATGIYGHSLPPQHGAPIRLVVPWKYGFKSAKAIVALQFTAERPGPFGTAS
jgi:DNA repair protein RadA/Sms